MKKEFMLNVLFVGLLVFTLLNAVGWTLIEDVSIFVVSLIAFFFVFVGIIQIIIKSVNRTFLKEEVKLTKEFMLGSLTVAGLILLVVSLASNVEGYIGASFAFIGVGVSIVSMSLMSEVELEEWY